jgi:hypothetical protein
VNQSICSLLGTSPKTKGKERIEILLVAGVGERGAITNSLSLSLTHTHRQERAQPETARGVKRIPNQAGVFQEEEEEEQDRRKGKEEDRRVPIPVSCSHSQPASAPSVSV